MRSKKQNKKRRPVRNRPGSVLILVIALLVLLALIGTAFLSTTQTERYSAQQHSVNTEADLLLQGLIDATNSAISAPLFVSNGSGTQYRPPGQEMPTYKGAAAQAIPTNNYNNYDSTGSDLFLASRWPDNTVNTGTGNGSGLPFWDSISYSLFPDASGSYAFDSPFGNSIPFYLAANKSQVQAYPTSVMINSQLYPAMLYYIPASNYPAGTLASGTTYPAHYGVVLQEATGPVPYPNIPNGDGLYLTPNGPTVGPAPAILMSGSYNTSLQQDVCLAASASGDGIADSGLTKMPVGQINNITYYYALRCIDNNSAINASCAWTVANDPTNGAPLANYGFFPGNVGLLELLSPQSPNLGGPTAAQEMAALNTYRFGGAFQPATGTTSSVPPTFSLTPLADIGQLPPNPPLNFTWYSFNDALYNQLTRRPGNPGTLLGGTSCNWLGNNQSAALAYHFTLTNPNSSQSYLEQLLPNELLNYAGVRSTPYSPNQIGNSVSSNGNWYRDQFTAATAGTLTYPLRTLLTGDNAVSNAAPSRYGNASATTPVQWTNTGTGYYNFGDWVVDGPAGNQRSFVCIRRHLQSTSPEPQTTGGILSPPFAAANPAAVGYWAGAQGQLSNTSRYPGLPFAQQPVKTSVNTATFGELYLAFAQVMTDSIGNDNQPQFGPNANGTTLASHWQPPMQGEVLSNTGEQQLPMFRSVLRDSKLPLAGKTLLTAAQMLKLRAALAAINTIDLRDGDNDVTSAHIVLDDSTGAPQYDAEVFGTEMQPYISEVVLQVNAPTQTTQSSVPYSYFFAIKLVNPYPTKIYLDNWQFGSVLRSNFPNLKMSATSAPILPAGTYVPGAVANVPGILVLYDSTTPAPNAIPTDIQTTISDYAKLQPYLRASITPVYVANLLQQAVTDPQNPVLNEVFLMRPRSAQTTSAGRNPASQNATSGNSDDVFNENVSNYPLCNLVPVDQIDLTGLQLPAVNSNMAKRFDYRRGSDGVAGKAWNFVYPGYYDPATTATTGRYFDSPGFNALSEGNPAIVSSTGTIGPNGQLPQLTPTNMGGADGGAGLSDATAASPGSTYTTAPLELNNQYMAGPYPINASQTNLKFPFGGFARNVDMMQIPFIGAYRIQPYSNIRSPSTSTFTEMNSVTMDSALANDNSTGVAALPPALLPSNPSAGPLNLNEQIGRFCPIGTLAATLTNGSTPDPTRLFDFGAGFTTTGLDHSLNYWHYHWTRKLFSYLTVQAPQDDYFPNVDPTQTVDQSVTIQGQTTLPPPKYPNGLPTPVANSNPAYHNAQTAGKAEDIVGVQGLVNINTAPVPVLAALPWTNVTMTNLTIAQGIVAYRSANGPFKSILDLYNVTAVQQQSRILTATQPGYLQGEFSPNGLGIVADPLPSVRYDFQDHFLLLNNVSNLITTRSDSFTCYVLLQGWRNAGTGNPTLAVQRRAAFMVDRTGVTPSNIKAAYSLFPSQ
jgi:DNA uptake protein ComE-like DNA-binding protein